MESVCRYSVNIRLSWHIGLSLLLPISPHLPQGNKGTKAQVKSLGNVISGNATWMVWKQPFKIHVSAPPGQQHSLPGVQQELPGCYSVLFEENLLSCQRWQCVCVEKLVVLILVSISSRGNGWLWNLQSDGKLLVSSWYLLQARCCSSIPLSMSCQYSIVGFCFTAIAWKGVTLISKSP